MSRRSLPIILVLACLVAAPTLAVGPDFTTPDLPVTPAADRGAGEPGFSWVPVARADGYRLPDVAERPAREAMREAQNRLAAEAPRGAATNAIAVTISEEERSSITGSPDGKMRRFRVGVSKDLGLGVDFSTLSPGELRGDTRQLTFGAVRGTRDGGYVWTGVLSAPGANAIRLHLTDFDLPRGAQLWVYNLRGQAFGPYVSRGPEGTGELWTQAVFGDRLRLQLRQTGPVDRDTLDVTGFVIASLGYIGPRFELAKDDAVRWDISTGKIAAAGYCPDNADCVVGVCETSTSSAVSLAKDAVAHMLFASGPYYYICSGGLLADTEQSGTPYFLTANHCISKGNEASSLETYFGYDDPSCNCPDPPYRNYTTLGADILSTNRSSDYTLMELSSTPSGAAFLGWNSSPVANDDGTALYRISHPSGVPQAYSEHSVDTSKGTCSSWPRGDWIYSHDDFGATEGGSSGSPVLNAAGEVVGQLSGACGTNVNDTCDVNSNATVDGALAAYYSDVSQWLDGGGGSCTPSTEVCDGQDNECDGLIDEGDVCGGSCLPKGQSCDANSECCSNKCKGRAGSQSCK